MKKIYIVLTHTGTNLSKIIKGFMKDEFSHVSISLDAQLNHMYSFGRLHPYNPFWGGLVHEYVDKGTFKRFYKTKAKIYSLYVTENEYKIIKDTIKKVEKGNYGFNVLGLFAVGFHKKIGKEHSFYCAEFVKYVLEKAQIDTNLPQIVRPENFKNMPGLQEVYTGLLRKYNLPKDNITEILRDNLLETLCSKEERAV